MKTFLSLTLLSLAISIQATVNGQEKTFLEFVQIYNNKLAAQNLHIHNELHDFIPRKFNEIRNEHLVTVNVFLTADEITRVRQTVSVTVVKSGKIVINQMVDYINTLNSIQIYILKTNKKILNAIDLKFPNKFNQHFLQHLKNWQSNPLTQTQVNTIEEEIAMSSIICIEYEIRIDEDLKAIREMKTNLYRDMFKARIAFEKIMTLPAIIKKGPFITEIENVMPTITNQFNLLKLKYKQLKDNFKVYNNERNKVSLILLEESGDSMES